MCQNRPARRVLGAVVLIVLVCAVTGTATAQTVEEVDATLSDEDGDGTDDRLTVDATVADDGGATGIEVSGPVDSIEIPPGDDGEDQAPVTNVSGNTARFGSTGYTGTYSVGVTLSEPSEGDTVEVTVWIGAVEEAQADDVQETSVSVGTDSETETETEGDGEGETDGSGATGGDDSTSDGTDETPDDGSSVGGGESDDGDGGPEAEGGQGMPGFTLSLSVIALLLTAVAIRGRTRNG
jgi:hypothetical protein